MKRDMDLARKILLWMEEHDAGDPANHAEFGDFAREQVGYHCHLLAQAGLIKAADTSAMESAVPTAIPISVTWQGHEFIDASKDSAVWAKAKSKVIAPAGGVAFSVLLEWLKAEAKARLGLA